MGSNKNRKETGILKLTDAAPFRDYIFVMKKAEEKDTYSHIHCGQMHIWHGDLEYEGHNVAAASSPYQKITYAFASLCGTHLKYGTSGSFSPFSQESADMHYETLLNAIKEIYTEENLSCIEIPRFCNQKDSFDDSIEEDFSMCAKPSISGPAGIIMPKNKCLLETFLKEEGISLKEFISNPVYIVLNNDGKNTFQCLLKNKLIHESAVKSVCWMYGRRMFRKEGKDE